MTRTLPICLAIGMIGVTALPVRAEPFALPGTCSAAVLQGSCPGHQSACQGYPDCDPFAAGTWSLQFMSGYYSMTSLGPGGPKIDYAPQAFRLGYMWTTPEKPAGTWWRGNWETLLEVYYAPILREFGTYFTGPTLISRWNFVQPDSVVVPYVQGAAGFAFTDAHREQNQSLIGSQCEFMLHSELGLRFMVTECVSFDVEAGFGHVSNASTARRNAGINNVGGSIGLTYSFGKR